MRITGNGPIVLVVVASMGAMGCASVKASNYGASTENVLRLREYAPQGSKIAVAEFTSTQPGLKVLTCRLAAKVSAPGSHTFASFIREALISDLQLAELYSADTQAVLKANLDLVEMSAAVGNGKWRFKLTFEPEGGQAFTVESLHEFSTNWVGDKACQQVAQELTPAVQRLVRAITSKPEFLALVQKK